MVTMTGGRVTVLLAVHVAASKEGTAVRFRL